MEPLAHDEYQEALDWIHSTMRFGSKLGLQRIQRLLSLLGHPEEGLRCIHVAGTNGKALSPLWSQVRYLPAVTEPASTSHLI